MLDVGKDAFYKELHVPANQATLRNFATDKKLRTLILAKIAQNTIEEEGKTEAASEDELRFTTKVEYLGPNAHSIAFVKREAYATLELRASSEDSMRHLSSQLQILNLGYMGEDSSIFELAVSYVEYSLIPLFNTYKAPGQTSSQSESDKKGGSMMQGLDNV